MSKHSVSRGLAAIGALCAAWAVVIFTTGGFVWQSRWIRVASRDPFRPFVAGVLAALVSLYLAPDVVTGVVDRAGRIVARRGLLIAAAIAAAVAVGGFAYSTDAASGSDSYGYVSQADLWLAGQLRIDQRALDLPPPLDDSWVFSPLGYHPGPQPHVIVPTYPPGLPLLMAAAKSVAGSNGAFYVVPVMGAMAVMFTFVLGRLMFDETVGVAAAALLAASPVFLYQLMWPMSDVPATAAWTLAIVFAVSRRPLAAGAASAAAIVIRPNLVPIAIGVATIALWPAEWRGRRAPFLRACLEFAAGAVPGAIAIAALNRYLYGGAAVPSYTNIDSLFRYGYAATNLARYGPWLLQTQTPFILAAVLPIVSRRFCIPGAAAEQTRVRVGAALCLFLLALSYLFYQPYDDWWFLRFFLPGFPLLLALAAGALRAAAALFVRGRERVALAAIVVIVFGWELSTAQARGVSTLRRSEQRYVAVGRDLAASTPKNAVFLAMQHSGSLRYYAQRLTARYDAVPPDALDRALALLQSRGLRPYFLLEEWEVPVFRARFAGASAAGRLEWRPTRVWPTAVKVVLYDPMLVRRTDVNGLD